MGVDQLTRDGAYPHWAAILPLFMLRSVLTTRTCERSRGCQCRWPAYARIDRSHELARLISLGLDRFELVVVSSFGIRFKLGFFIVFECLLLALFDRPLQNSESRLSASDLERARGKAYGDRES